MCAAELSDTAVRGIAFLTPGGLFGRVAMVILIRVRVNPGLPVLNVICALFGRDGASFTPVRFDSQSFTIVFECLPLSPIEAKLSH